MPADPERLEPADPGESSPSEREMYPLEVLSAYPELLELAADNPALAALLLMRFKAVGREALGRMIRDRKQRDLCSLVGLPKRESTAKILRKLPTGSCSREAVENLAALILHRRHVKALRHLPRLSECVLGLLNCSKIQPLLSQTLLREIAANLDLDRSAELKTNLERYFEAESQLEPGATIPPIESLDDLHRRLSRLVAPPPLALPGHFIPLTSAFEIEQEAKAQRNCLASSIPAVNSGDLFCYRMNAPERATVSIAKTQDHWAMREIKGPCNWKVHPATEHLVGEIIDSCDRGEAIDPCLLDNCPPAYINLADVRVWPPPFQPPRGMRPITGAQDLLREGNLSREDAELILPRMRNGDVAVLLVLEPVPAKVILVNTGYIHCWHEPGRWEIHDIHVENGTPTWEIHDAIQKALEASPLLPND